MRHFETYLRESLIAGFSGRYIDYPAYVDRLKLRLRDPVQATKAVQTAAVRVLSDELWLPHYGTHDEGAKSITDDPRFVEVIRHLDPTVSPLTANVLWTLSAYMRTRRCYRVTPSLGQRLRQTELRGLHAPDLRLPYPAIYIEIPKEAGLAIYNSESGWHKLVGCYVVEEPAPWRKWWLLCWGEGKGYIMPGMPDDALLYWCIKLPDRDDRSIEQIIDDAKHPDRVETYAPPDIRKRYAQFNAQPWPDIFRWVMNLVVYVTHPGARLDIDPASEKAYRERRHGRTPAKRKQADERWRRFGHVIDAGHGLEPLGSHALNVRTLVTGHWKRVVYGAKREQRKLTWIQPYWRGPETAPVSETQHKV